MTIKRDFAALEEYIDKLMAEHGCPGLSLAIGLGDEVLYSRGFGRCNEAGESVTPDTIFGIASITKTFTSVALLKLHESGKLNLADAVRKYLPDFRCPAYTDDITITHLLNHTSGLPLLPAMRYAMRFNTPQGEYETPLDEVVPMATTGDLLSYIGRGEQEMLGAPGRYINYSNDGYGLLGAIIEAVSGVSYEEYVRQSILEPLGLDFTGVDLGRLREKGRVTELYYHNDAGELINTSTWPEAPSHIACGWLRSSAKDLLRFWQMLAGRGVYKDARILHPATWEQLLKRRAHFTLQRDYGLGVRIQHDYAGNTIMDHTGGLRGISSNAGLVKDKGIAVAALSNLSGFPISLVWTAAVNTMLGLPLTNPRYVYPTVEWSNEVKARRTGTFAAAEGFSSPLVIEHEGSDLVVHQGADSNVLIPASEDTAVLEVVGQDMSREVRFHADAEGNTWAVGTGNRIFPRVVKE